MSSRSATGNTNDPAAVGRWDPLIDMPNVPVHASLLPDGNVLFWGRRENAQGGMDQHVCTPQIWKRASNTGPAAFVPTPQPLAHDGKTTTNLFCSGHALLPDGTVFVAGGHLQDTHGLDQACFYDWRSNTWTPLPPMNNGRSYPTVSNLADGSVLVTSGSFGQGNQSPNNSTPQVWSTEWLSLADNVISLYPRMVLLTDGRLFVAGTDPKSFFLDPRPGGSWSPAPDRAGGDRQYAPTVMYRPGKIAFFGGGNDPGTELPGAATEMIDFSRPNPAWTIGRPMAFRRRQHNATLLPDGTVLVTGGTQGPGFNSLAAGQPVHEPELWNPDTDAWTTLVPEDRDRCYHSIALLLPDATVLSAGGGEYFTHDNTIDPKDIQKNGQVFHPPYLFKGARPVIRSASIARAPFGANFTLTVDTAIAIKRVTALRLGSVTHAFDSNQRLVELAFRAEGNMLHVTAAANGDACPPGFYMIFALNDLGVPSIACIMAIGPERAVAEPGHVARAAPFASLLTARTAPRTGTEVVVGLTSQCPYGLSACWAGARQSLSDMSGVSVVDENADRPTSTAKLWLTTNGLPDIVRWTSEFVAQANGSYHIRGFEVTVSGRLQLIGTDLDLDLQGQTVRLSHLRNDEKVQWDWSRKARAAVTLPEGNAYQDLLLEASSGKRTAATVTGPLHVGPGGLVLAVRIVQ